MQIRAVLFLLRMLFSHSCWGKIRAVSRDKVSNYGRGFMQAEQVKALGMVT